MTKHWDFFLNINKNEAINLPQLFSSDPSTQSSSPSQTKDRSIHRWSGQWNWLGRHVSVNANVIQKQNNSYFLFSVYKSQSGHELSQLYSCSKFLQISHIAKISPAKALKAQNSLWEKEYKDESIEAETDNTPWKTDHA